MQPVLECRLLQQALVKEQGATDRARERQPGANLGDEFRNAKAGEREGLNPELWEGSGFIQISCVGARLKPTDSLNATTPTGFCTLFKS